MVLYLIFLNLKILYPNPPYNTNASK